MPGQSILVVDDEQDMRVALTHALSRSGHSVETASSGFEALEKFKSEEFGLVITDVKMPEMSGMEVLEGIKKLSPQVPVIMITAYGTVNNAVEAMKEGASDYILKPFDSEILESAVKRACTNSNGKKSIEVYSNGNSETKKIITQDSKMVEILNLAKNVAPSNATVLILGESGTGKELLASYVHQHSGKSKGPYVAVNCTALPESLAESELFGHEKGSFTGAASRKIGKFELANHGTILLDEISEMAMPLQAKLLRVLQEREIDRVGGNRPVPIDVRIIAISNIDLKKAVKEGKFREDLFYRVNVIPLTVPPLRERKGDIPLLANYFLEKYSSADNKKMKEIAEETISLLLQYDWKGNIREFENTIERAVLLGKGETLLPKHLFLEEPESNGKEPFPIRTGLSVKEMERELIFQTLKEVNGNRTHATKMLGISIRTLRNKLREYKRECQS
ncbi:MAG: sigma-54-dependent Fis family transcriptional regulator [Deltaproteobacteria bacterium]|nr:sigma-54-dependent Fis family transcriptional regulator [Deltaproteobacteria bacterium]MBW1738357.1 sigma-54-dependent Fis family transcriptional regulator [Deltaproteobacteria bacterium]MBW1909224.1 sigma-54-dependent Fis family transcriptional regulator [Deltaproteobacteria bacterium]MBW2035215.1 sigma-54-dependent Fis family transcriptional regulator [Deltaproteobacteria bacterium]MBW2115645.1 sigma-54-dependent Fis family transcriptional regulator [Deltaproteobacteria bacterium]